MDATRVALITRIEGLNNKQIQTINSFVDYHFKPESVDAEIDTAKQIIYSKYRNSIASLINKIEIYEHNFLLEAYSGVETLFRCMSAIELEEKSTALKLYEDVKVYAEELESELTIHLVKLYLKRLRKYKRVLMNFNYKGVVPELRKGFNDTIKIAKTELKFAEKLHRKRYTIACKTDLDNSFSIDVAKEAKQNALKQALKDVEKLVDFCEEKYSVIVSNGYAGNFISRLFPIISLLATCLFSYIGTRKLLEMFFSNK